MRHHLHHQPYLQVGHDHPQLCHALMSVRGGREVQWEGEGVREGRRDQGHHGLRQGDLVGVGVVGQEDRHLPLHHHQHGH